MTDEVALERERCLSLIEARIAKLKGVLDDGGGNASVLRGSLYNLDLMVQWIASDMEAEDTYDGNPGGDPHPNRCVAKENIMEKTIRYRRSKLDAYRNMVGKVPDKEIAELAGVTPDGVRMFRMRHGIPSFREYARSRGSELRLILEAPPEEREVVLRTFRVVLEVTAENVIEAAEQVVNAGKVLRIEAG